MKNLFSLNKKEFVLNLNKYLIGLELKNFKYLSNNNINIQDTNLIKNNFNLKSSDVELFYKSNNFSTSQKIAANLYNIEFNAIISYSLILCNFKEIECFPKEFIKETINIVLDEIKHFNWISEFLNNSFLDVRNIPGNMNIISDIDKINNLLDYICLISLTHEGKGIDAGDRLSYKIKTIKNNDLLKILQNILLDEKNHVIYGVKWYKYMTEKYNLDYKNYYKEFLSRLNINIYNPNELIRNEIGFDFYK